MPGPDGLPVPGETVGPYRVVRRIGSGGMGAVYEAEDVGLHRSVALKVIAPALASEPDFRARFTREARAQASLDSPHVVQVHAHGETDGRLWMASQLIPDGDLGTRLAAGPLPLAEALEVVAQVADGLSAAHEAGVVHRDIKPANVLLRRRPGGGPGLAGVQAYLTDFGIARRVTDDHTRTTAGIAGTPTYMAPELHTGTPAGAASDVYSVGCLLWAVLAGRAPFTGGSDYAIVRAHVEDAVPQLPDVSPAVTQTNRVLRTALAKDPAARQPSAAVLRDELRAAAALPGGTRPGPVMPPPVPPAPPGPPSFSTPPVAPSPPPAGTSSGRRVGVVAGLVALVLLLAVGLGWALTRDAERATDAGVATSAAPTREGTSEATEPGASSTPTTADTPTSPTPSETSETSAPSSGYVVRPGDEARARVNLTRAIREQFFVVGSEAGCVARKWIRGAGLQRMVDQGLFDKEMTYYDLDVSQLDAQTRTALTDATLACTPGFDGLG